MANGTRREDDPRAARERIRQRELQQLQQEQAGRPTWERDIRSGARRVRAAGPSLRAGIAGLTGNDEAVVRASEDAQQIQQEAAAIQPDVPRASDIQSISEVPEYVLRTATQQLPHLLAQGVGAVAGGGTGRAVAGLRRLAPEATRRATQVGAVGGAATTSAGLQTSENIPGLVLDPEARENRTPSQLARQGLAFSGAGGALDIVPAAGVLKRLGLARNTDNLLRRTIGGVTGQAAREGLTEGAQQALQLGSLRIARQNFDALTDDELRDLFDATAAGAAAGGVLGGGVDLAAEVGQQLGPFRQKLADRRAERELASFREARGVEAQHSLDPSEPLDPERIERMIRVNLPEDHPVRQDAAALRETAQTVADVAQGRDVDEARLQAFEQRLGGDALDTLVEFAAPQQDTLSFDDTQLDTQPDEQSNEVFDSDNPTISTDQFTAGLTPTEPGVTRRRRRVGPLQTRELSERLAGQTFESSSVDKRLGELRQEAAQRRMRDLREHGESESMDEALAAVQDQFEAVPVTERLNEQADGDPEALTNLARSFAERRIEQNPRLAEAYDPDNPTAFTDQFVDIAENVPNEVFQTEPEFELRGKPSDFFHKPPRTEEGRRKFDNAIPVRVNDQERFLLANRLTQAIEPVFMDQGEPAAQGTERVGRRFAAALSSLASQEPSLELPSELDSDLVIGSLVQDNGPPQNVRVRDLPAAMQERLLRQPELADFDPADSTQEEGGDFGDQIEDIRPRRESSERALRERGIFPEEREQRDVIERRFTREELEEEQASAEAERVEIRRRPNTKNYSVFNTILENAKLRGQARRLPKDFKGVQNLGRDWMERIGLDPRAIRIEDAETAFERLSDFREGLQEGSPLANRVNGALSNIATVALGRSKGVFLPAINGRARIVIDDTMPVPDQIATLAHELGHAVFRGVKLSRQQAQAIKQAYDQWLVEQNARAGDTRFASVFASMASPSSLSRFIENGFEVKPASVTVQGDAKTQMQDLSDAERAYYTNFEEWFAENVARWMTTDAQPLSMVDQYFKGVADMLRKLLSLLRSSRLIRQSMETPEAVRRLMNDLFDKSHSHNEARFRQHTLFELNPEISADALNNGDLQALHAMDPNGVPGHMELIRQFRETLNEGEFGALVKVFHNSTVRTRLLDKLREQGSPGHVAAAAKDPIIAAAYGYQLWLDNDLDVSPATGNLYSKLQQAGDRALAQSMDAPNAEDVLTKTRMALAGFRRESDFSLALKPTPPNVVADRLVGYASKMGRFLRPLYTSQGRMHATGNPTLIAVSNRFQVRVGQENRGEGYFGAKNRQLGHFSDRLNQATKDLDEDQGRELAEVMLDSQREIIDPEIQAAQKQVRQILNEFYNYMTNAGLELGQRENYFPWTFDVDRLINNRQKFVDLLAQEKFSEDLLALPITPEGMTLQQLDQDTRERLANKLFDQMMQTNGYADVDMDATKSYVPTFRRINHRLLGFIQDKGSETDQAALNEFFDRDIGTTLFKYIDQGTKRAEFAREFGADGQEIKQAIEDARATGASEQDIADFRTHVNAMLGTLGADEFHPMIKRTLQAWDRVVGTELAKSSPQDSRTVQGWLMVIQNVQILGLATLTSLSDSAGLVSRGESLDVAFESFKAGVTGAIKRMRGQRDELLELARDLGVVEHHLANRALGEVYGGVFLTGTARKINEKFFRLIGLQQWTQGTRYMGLAGARRFIPKHAARAKQGDEKSLRFLRQLSLEPDDVVLDDDGSLQVLNAEQREQASAEELARDERVRAAMNQYVDEAIVRPNAAQRPDFLTHPDLMLVAHLKQYQFSIYDRLLRRMGSEIAQGNYYALTFPVAAVTIMLTQELLREQIQFGDDGDPRKRHWTWQDYLHHANHRAGVYGYHGFLMDAQNDRQFGGIGIESFAGPSAQWVGDMLDVLSDSVVPGADHNELAKRAAFLMRSLPANSIYKNWDMSQSHDEQIAGMYNFVEDR